MKQLTDPIHTNVGFIGRTASATPDADLKNTRLLTRVARRRQPRPRGPRPASLYQETELVSARFCYFFSTDIYALRSRSRPPACITSALRQFLRARDAALRRAVWIWTRADAVLFLQARPRYPDRAAASDGDLPLAAHRERADEGMTAIDVNSGRLVREQPRTGAEDNLEAARENHAQLAAARPGRHHRDRLIDMKSGSAKQAT